MSSNEFEKKARPASASESWLGNARQRRQNRKWLEYSSQIARRMLAAIDEKPGMTQKKLAEQIQVSPQYISKIAKGGENLTLETISKLAAALETELISFPDFAWSRPVETKIFIPVAGRSQWHAEAGTPIQVAGVTPAFEYRHSEWRKIA
jgi:transcriptional regulator with XRE-family HTH domain